MGATTNNYEDGIWGNFGDINSWVKIGRGVGLLGPISGTEGPVDLTNLSEQYIQDMNALIENCYLRKIVYTNSGHIGLCPK